MLAVVFHVILAQGQLQLDGMTGKIAKAQHTYEARRLELARMSAPERIIGEAERLGLVRRRRRRPISPSSGAPTPAAETEQPSTTLSDWKEVKPHLGTRSRESPAPRRRIPPPARAAYGREQLGCSRPARVPRLGPVRPPPAAAARAPRQPPRRARPAVRPTRTGPRPQTVPHGSTRRSACASACCSWRWCSRSARSACASSNSRRAIGASCASLGLDQRLQTIQLAAERGSDLRPQR